MLDLENDLSYSSEYHVLHSWLEEIAFRVKKLLVTWLKFLLSQSFKIRLLNSRTNMEDGNLMWYQHEGLPHRHSSNGVY